MSDNARFLGNDPDLPVAALETDASQPTCSCLAGPELQLDHRGATHTSTSSHQPLIGLQDRRLLRP